MTRKRDNNYYKKQLRTRYPAIHQDVVDGKLSLAEALRQSGLKKQRTRLHELMNAWNKATPSEQAKFLRRTGHSPAATVASPVPSSTTIHHAGRLTADGQDAIRRFMNDEGFGHRFGEIMKLIGRNPYDTSIGMAMSRGTNIKPDLLVDLETILRARGYFS